MGHDKDAVLPFRLGLVVALGHAAKLFAKCCLPYFLGDGVFDEFALLGDGLVGGWMDDWGAKMLHIEVDIICV